jgi:hypothetical protein
MKPSRILVALAMLGLASCGRVAELKPAAGKSLPVRPLMARTTPTANDLLTLPPYARPDRIDELMKKSEPRQPDPFALPPPTGGPAPTLPAGTEPGPVSNDIGVSNPGD